MWRVCTVASMTVGAATVAARAAAVAAEAGDPGRGTLVAVVMMMMIMVHRGGPGKQLGERA